LESTLEIRAALVVQEAAALEGQEVQPLVGMEPLILVEVVVEQDLGL
jgi:hypothetical protein